MTCRRGVTVSTRVADIVGAVVPTDRGDAVTITERGFELIGSPANTLLGGASGPSGERMNDGKCDRRGRFWTGQPTYEFALGGGSLWVWDPVLGLRQVDAGLTLPNGIGGSLDERAMYLVDSIDRCLYRFAFDVDSGAVGDRVALRQFDGSDGPPDGMAIDAEGCLRIACHSGSCIRRLDPSGDDIARVPLAVSQPTSCCFGPPGELFVTTATQGSTVPSASGNRLPGRCCGSTWRLAVGRSIGARRQVV